MWTCRSASQQDDERPSNSLPEEAQVSSSCSTEGATVLQATFNLVSWILDELWFILKVVLICTAAVIR